MASPTAVVPDPVAPDAVVTPDSTPAPEVPSSRRVVMAKGVPGLAEEFVDVPADPNQPAEQRQRGPDGKFLPVEGAAQAPEAPQNTAPVAPEQPWTPVEVDGIKFNTAEDLKQYVKTSQGRDRTRRELAESTKRMREALDRKDQELLALKEAVTGRTPQNPAPQPANPEPAAGPHSLLEGINWPEMDRLPLDSDGVTARLQHALSIIAENAQAQTEKRIAEALNQRLQPFEDQRRQEQGLTYINGVFKGVADSVDEQGERLFPELQDVATVQAMWPIYEHIYNTRPELAMTEDGIKLALYEYRNSRTRLQRTAAPTPAPLPRPVPRTPRLAAPEVLPTGTGTPRPAPGEPDRATALVKELQREAPARLKNGMSLGVLP